MKFLNILAKVVTGAAAGVAVVTALPVFGAVGAITAVGAAVGSVLGGALGAADAVNKDGDD